MDYAIQANGIFGVGARERQMLQDQPERFLEEPSPWGGGQDGTEGHSGHRAQGRASTS